MTTAAATWVFCVVFISPSGHFVRATLPGFASERDCFVQGSRYATTWPSGAARPGAAQFEWVGICYRADGVPLPYAAQVAGR